MSYLPLLKTILKHTVHKYAEIKGNNCKPSHLCGTLHDKIYLTELHTFSEIIARQKLKKKPETDKYCA